MILRAKSLNLGDPAVFPFIDPANIVVAPDEVIFRILYPSDTYKLPDESIAIAFPPDIEFAYVLTVTTDLTLSLLVTDKVAAVRLALVDTSPDSPHDTITPDGFASVNDDASHFTHEETLNGDEPTGNEDNIEVDMYDPLEKTRPRLGKDDDDEGM